MSQMSEEDDEKQMEEDLPEIGDDSEEDLEDKYPVEVIEGDPGCETSEEEHDHWIRSLKKPYQRYLAKQVKLQRFNPERARKIEAAGDDDPVMSFFFPKSNDSA